MTSPPPLDLAVFSAAVVNLELLLREMSADLSGTSIAEKAQKAAKHAQALRDSICSLVDDLEVLAGSAGTVVRP